MEIDFSDMHSYYKAVRKNASELFGEITQNQSFDSSLADDRFNEIVRDCQIFGNEIWTAISRLCNDAEGKENAHTDNDTKIAADEQMP
jgi:hypothetical protein